MSVIQDIVRFAEAHGIDVPNYNPDGSTTVEATLRQIAAAEQAAIVELQTILDLKLAGLVTSNDYAEADRIRDTLYQAQTRMYADLTSGTLYQALASVGAISRIPRPQRLPDIRNAPAGARLVTESGRAALAGLGTPAAVAAVPVTVWAVIVIGLVAIVAGAAVIASSMNSAVESYVAARAHERTLRTRQENFQRCLETGTDPETCATIARETAPELIAPRPSRSWIWYVAGGVVVVGGAYLGFKYLSARAGSAGSRDALRGLGAPRRLESLDDEYPSRYFLEIGDG